MKSIVKNQQSTIESGPDRDSRPAVHVFRLTSSGSRSTNDRGMALVLTLLVVALITAMVVEFAYGVYVSTSALHNWQTSQQLSVAARSAARLGSRLISQNNALQQSYTYPGLFQMSQKMPFEDIDGIISIRIEDENAKFNLNQLRGLPGMGDPEKSPYNSFKRLLKALDLNTDIADRVSYWTNSNTEHRPSSGKTATKDGYLDSIDELLLIPGIDRESYERLKPYVTIYSDNSINVNTADIPVLLSFYGMTKDTAEKLISQRENIPFTKREDIPLEVRNLMGALGYVKASAFRVVATAESGGIRRIIETVLDGSGKTVKYWKEI